MIVDVGDAPTVTWHVRDDGGTPIDPALVTATLTDPVGAVTVLTVGHPGVGEYTVTPAFTAAGAWVVTWTSTNPGAVHVDAFAATLPGEAPVWSPDLRRVGSHIPSRTRDQTTGEPVGTFTDDTYPTGDQVEQIITSAVAAVAGQVGRPVVPAAHPLCETAAALWAAYWVELAWPDRDGNVSVFARLRDDAVMLTEQAKSVNVGAGGGTDGTPDDDGVPDQLPLYSFPPARCVIL